MDGMDLRVAQLDGVVQPPSIDVTPLTETTRVLTEETNLAAQLADRARGVGLFVLDANINGILLVSKVAGSISDTVSGVMGWKDRSN